MNETSSRLFPSSSSHQRSKIKSIALANLTVRNRHTVHFHQVSDISRRLTAQGTLFPLICSPVVPPAACHCTCKSIPPSVAERASSLAVPGSFIIIFCSTLGCSSPFICFASAFLYSPTSPRRGAGHHSCSFPAKSRSHVRLIDEPYHGAKYRLERYLLFELDEADLSWRHGILFYERH